jgi:hypothetical protein
MRTVQLTEATRTEKSRIDCISLYPVELKSNCDVLDGRLPNQIMNAILTFGRSIVVLDTKHVNKNSIKFLRLLPATTIGYTGVKDHFEILSVYDRIMHTGMFNFSKRRFAKTMIENGIVKGIDKIYRRLRTLDHINQKLVFNELYDSNPGFLKEEIEFLVQFSKVRVAYLTGTHNGAFGDLQSTGKKFKVNGMTEFSFSNAKIVERWNLVGMVSLKEQLTG